MWESDCREQKGQVGNRDSCFRKKIQQEAKIDQKPKFVN